MLFKDIIYRYTSMNFRLGRRDGQVFVKVKYLLKCFTVSDPGSNVCEDCEAEERERIEAIASTKLGKFLFSTKSSDSKVSLIM